MFPASNGQISNDKEMILKYMNENGSIIANMSATTVDEFKSSYFEHFTSVKFDDARDAYDNYGTEMFLLLPWNTSTSRRLEKIY